MSFDSFNPFKRKPAAAETGAKTPEGDLTTEVAKVVSDLEATHGVDATNEALERIVGTGPVNLEENLTSFPPASSDLIKWIEPLSHKYGQDEMLRTLRVLQSKRKFGGEGTPLSEP